MKRTILILFYIFIFAFCSKTVIAEEISFSLSDCIKYCLLNNPELESYKYKIDSYIAKIKQAESPYNPTLNITSTYNKYTASQINYNTYYDTVYLTQLITDFNRTEYNVDMAKETLLQKNYEFYNKIQDTTLNLIIAYYNILKNRHLIDASNKNITRLTKTLNQTKAFFDVGLKSKIDVTTASVNLSEAKLQLIQFENDLNSTYQALYNAMGFEQKETINIYDVEKPAPKLYSFEQLHKTALEERRDLKIVESQLKTAQILVKYNETGTNPNLSAGSKYTWNGAQYPLPGTWEIGMNLSWTLYDGGATIWKVKDAAAQVGEQTRLLQAKKNLIKKELADTFSDMNKNLESIKLLKDKLAQASENLKLAEGRYSVGISDIIELSKAQYDYIKAEEDLIISNYDYLKSIAALEKTTGIDLQKIYLKTN